MSALRWFVLSVLVAGCTREPAPSNTAVSETLAILAAHHAADVEPGGKWVRMDSKEAWFLDVEASGPGRWVVHQVQGVPAFTPSPEPESRTLAATWADGILTLDAPLDGSTRLHLCRFGRRAEAVLVPESAVRFDDSGEPIQGAVYEQVEPDLDELRAYSPGPEDEDRWWQDRPR